MNGEHEMQIFNEDLKKYLSNNNDFDEGIGDFIFTITFYFSSCLILYFLLLIGGFIRIDGSFTIENNHVPYIFIYIILSVCVYLFMMNKRHEKQLQKNKLPNPIIEKLKNIYKCSNNSSLNHYDLIDIWREYKSHFINPSDAYSNTKLRSNANANVILLNQNKEKYDEESFKLFQKLDDDLVYFIESADDETIKLFNLESFDSYQKLYMKYIAPKGKRDHLKRIQNLIVLLSNANRMKENSMIQQLNELKNEIEEYDINTVDYFEFKKWHDDTWKLLLDKDNEMVKNNYQNIIQEINNSKKEDCYLTVLQNDIKL